MIEVGINENVVLKSVEIEDAEKGNLVFTWRDAVVSEEGESHAKLSAFEALAEDGYTETEDGRTLRMFGPLEPFKEKTDGSPVSREEQVAKAFESIAEKKNILFQIASVYTTRDKIKFEVYRGLGMTAENSDKKILELATLQKIMSNLATDFVKIVTPFLDKDEFAVRLLLVRRSKTKHFADFRQKFVKTNPFIESMKVPVEASKLAFTKHEIANGYDNGSPIMQNREDADAEKAEAMDAASVFGAQS